MGKNKMIDYNVVLYIGLALIIGGFCLFLYSEHKIRQCDIELARQQKLNDSFNKNKLSGGYIKKWITLMTLNLWCLCSH